MHNKESMLSALRNRKAHGLTIHIAADHGGVEGSPEEEKGEDPKMEAKELGLAPEGSAPEDAGMAGMNPAGDVAGQADGDKNHQMIAEELAKAGLAKGGLASKAHAAFLKKKHG